MVPVVLLWCSGTEPTVSQSCICMPLTHMFVLGHQESSPGCVKTIQPSSGSYADRVHTASQRGLHWASSKPRSNGLDAQGAPSLPGECCHCGF